MKYITVVTPNKAIFKIKSLKQFFCQTNKDKIKSETKIKMDHVEEATEDTTDEKTKGISH